MLFKSYLQHKHTPQHVHFQKGEEFPLFHLQIRELIHTLLNSHPTTRPLNIEPTLLSMTKAVQHLRLQGCLLL